MSNRYTLNPDPRLSAEAIALAQKEGSVSAQLIVWCAVHGNLQLALRCPDNNGASRPMVERFVADLGAWLVINGMFTPEILAEAERRESKFKPNTTLSLPEGTKARDQKIP